MKDTFATFEESSLDRLSWLESWSFHLECKLATARAAARINTPENYDRIAEAAKRCGYAVAVHGSRARDVDLIACPWTDEATDADTVAKTICEAIGGIVKGIPSSDRCKPHGRTGCVILVCGAYIDLSIMPRTLQHFTKDCDL